MLSGSESRVGIASSRGKVRIVKVQTIDRSLSLSRYRDRYRMIPAVVLSVASPVSHCRPRSSPRLISNFATSRPGYIHGSRVISAIRQLKLAAERRAAAGNAADLRREVRRGSHAPESSDRETVSEIRARARARECATPLDKSISVARIDVSCDVRGT